MSQERSESTGSDSSWSEEFEENRGGPSGLGVPGDEIISELPVSNENVRGNESSAPPVCSSAKIIFCYPFKLIRKLWATCETEDHRNNKDVIIKLMIREMIFHVIFLILFCFVSFGMTSSTTFYFTNSVAKLLTETPVYSINQISFQKIRSYQDWYNFVSEPLIENLYSNTKLGFNFSRNNYIERIDKNHPQKKPNSLIDQKMERKENPNLNFPQQQPSYPPTSQFLHPPSDPLRPLTEHDVSYNTSLPLLDNQLYGLPRLRMIRVENNTCQNSNNFHFFVQSCHGPYTSHNEDKNPFGPMNSSAWVYQSAEKLNTVGSKYQGKVSSYGNGGYVQDLGITYEGSLAMVNSLRNGGWLEEGNGVARAVFIDFNLYNPNVNLFCIVRLLTEFPATGGAINSWHLDSINLSIHSSLFDHVVLVCQFIVIIFLFYYIIEEIIEISKHKLKYFKRFFNLVDVILVFLLIFSLSFTIYKTSLINSIIRKNCTNTNNNYTSIPTTTTTISSNSYNNTIINLNQTQFSNISKTTFFSTSLIPTLSCSFPYTHINLQNVAYYQKTTNIFMSFSLLFAWIKLFKFIGFNRSLSQLSFTMSVCLKDLCSFSFIFLVVFLSFAQFAFLIFGSSLSEFKDFHSSIYSQFRILLGDFNFHCLIKANNVIGPLYFMSLVFVLFFIMANMFLAIINDAYSDVKIDFSRKKRDLRVIDYFKKGYLKMLENFALKHRKRKSNIEVTDPNTDTSAGDDAKSKKKNKDKGTAERRGGGRNRKTINKLKGNFRDSEEEEEEEVCDNSSIEESINKIKGIFGRTGRNRNVITGGGTKREGVGHEEFSLLQRRVDRLEHSIGSIVSKVDAILVKLEKMEKMEGGRSETLAKLLSFHSGQNEEMVERVIRDEGWGFSNPPQRIQTN